MYCFVERYSALYNFVSSLNCVEVGVFYHKKSWVFKPSYRDFFLKFYLIVVDRVEHCILKVFKMKAIGIVWVRLLAF